MLHDDMCHFLIHTDRTAHVPAADVWDATQLKQALNRSVLSVFSMQNREDAIHLNACKGSIRMQLQKAPAAFTAGQYTRCTVLLTQPGIMLDTIHITIICIPFPILADSDENKLIVLFIDFVNQTSRRMQGNRVFT